MSCEDCYRAGVVEGTAAAKQDTESLERLYARALDRVGTLEKTVTEVQIECTKLLEENRKLRSAAGSDPFYCQCCAMYECDCSVAR